ncbi:MAG: YgaP-like transmembrane domain [Bacillota bacterium]
MAGALDLEPNMGRADRYLRIAISSFLLAAGAAHMAREGGLRGVCTGLLGGMMLAGI